MTGLFTPRRFYASNTSKGWAVIYDRSPTSMAFPVLIVSDLVTDPESVAGDVAQILNQHWIIK
ncbi:hypothetical protein [Novosphingobium rosa]|uniref:hypothetical protein n=1 Tax=Novosphingobium rosa TaxID=76978 RepID=UPI0008352DAC|nr:hypothetical protein [Novosphingobium rosa]